MLLFLDVISPLPEFFVIEDNKVIFQTKITKNQSEKLSDNIFSTFIKINDNLDLIKKINKIAVTIGPGSYTSLRVGAAFMSGLQISKNLLYYSISATDIIKFISVNNKKNVGVYIYSANNQKFFCYMGKDKKTNFIKIEDNFNAIPKNITNVYYNIYKLNSNCNIENQFKFSFINMFLENQNKLSFSNKNIIRPIYISNNKILN